MFEVSDSLVIVTASRDSAGAVALEAAAKKLGVSVQIAVIGIDDIAMLVNQVNYRIFRMKPSTYRFYCDLSRTLGQAAPPQLSGALDAFDKGRTESVLAAHSVPRPTSYLFRRGDSCSDYPVVIKVLHGNQGIGVALLRNNAQLNEFLDQYHNEDEFLIQEYIEEAGACDKRLIVVGDEVVAAMTRTSTAGDFRANLHLGGVAGRYQPTPDEAVLAIRAAKSFHLDFAGVDIVNSDRGPLVLEVNPSPGFGISSVVGGDVAEMIIKKVMNV